MKIFQYFFLPLLVSIFICTSCNGQDVQRLEYLQSELVFDETYAPDLRHKTWTIVEDSENCDLNTLFATSRAVYKISHNHTFINLELPKGCEVYFSGGSLRGNVIFNNNYISGKVKLQGCTLDGIIANKSFEAGWICSGDGISDDAQGINEALHVCNNIHFQKGTYLLSSLHLPMSELADEFHESVKSHIGIYSSGKTLVGDDGACLLSKDANRVLTIYSQPNDIKGSIRDVEIAGLTFRVINNGKEFHEFVHTIKTLGVNGLKISDCKFFDYWGDAISLSHYGDNAETGQRTLNKDVVIDGNYIDGNMRNNRNGISVISGRNVTIINNTIVDTSRKDMPGAIDIEANSDIYTIKCIKIQNNIIDCSTTGGVVVYCNKYGAPAHDITICSNTITNCYFGVKIDVYSDNSTSDFILEKNKVSKCHRSIICIGESESKNWKINKNDFAGVKNDEIIGKMKVKNLIIE